MKMSVSYTHLDVYKRQEEQKLKMKFAPEQREAVKIALTQGLCIITGGPGTGKTLIQLSLIHIYGIPNSWKYPIGSHDIVDAGQWLSIEDSVLDPESGN